MNHVELNNAVRQGDLLERCLVESERLHAALKAVCLPPALLALPLGGCAEWDVGILRLFGQRLVCAYKRLLRLCKLIGR